MSILDDKWLLKIAKKMRKYVFLFNELDLERVLEFIIIYLYYFSILDGVIVLQFFPISARF